MSLHSLPEEFRNRLVNEFRLALAHMAEAESPAQYIFYYSIFYGEIVRVLNWHWDETLALIWSNVQHTHQAIATSVSATAAGNTAVALPKEFYDAVTRTSSALTDHVENNGDDAELCRILGRLAELTYSSTGNGYYLLQKGVIKLEG